MEIMTVHSKRSIFLWAALPALVLCYLSTQFAQSKETFTGQWLLEFNSEPMPVFLTLRHESDGGGRHDSSQAIPREQLLGLSQAQVSSSGSAVRFQIKREAGNLQCEGWFKEGKGSGHFSFSPDAAFATALKQRGFAVPTAEQQFSLAMHDVGLALLDELKKQGYEQPTLDQLVRIGTHGVRLDYIKGLAALGYKLQSVDNLVRT
ncbi:MAG TPA: hypothetical protein VMB70_11360 [Terriglobia bacterium]|nr:hypothetical protein [Terriglobia bacterium]